MWGKLHASLVYFQLRLYTEHEIWSRPFEAICLFYHTSSWRLPLALPCGVRRKSTRNWEEEKISRFFLFQMSLIVKKNTPPPPTPLCSNQDIVKRFCSAAASIVTHAHVQNRNPPSLG
ncbi:hypothetical protein OUZ56_028536 [Daphnia magna]|uniref:Uncharacterized protein n=1 Tax=Daphnia magna TaxID=35525 RepID=A0ABR0B4R3_9CRUS|nr:hypothetical protein OUZ56_028536 [Daphnia magna]